MEVTVTMNADDFADFMEWKKDRTVYMKKEEDVWEKLKKLAAKVLDTIEEREGTKEEGPEFRIKSNGAAAELTADAAEIFI